MLREMRDVRQVPGDRFRRWFTDEALEVVVWYETDGSIYGFQICYDPEGMSRALMWTRGRGFSHAELDDGEDKPSSNRTPILRPSSKYDAALLRKAFLGCAGGLPTAEKAFVESKLAESVQAG